MKEKITTCFKYRDAPLGWMLELNQSIEFHISKKLLSISLIHVNHLEQCLDIKVMYHTTHIN